MNSPHTLNDWIEMSQAKLGNVWVFWVIHFFVVVISAAIIWQEPLRTVYIEFVRDDNYLLSTLKSAVVVMPQLTISYLISRPIREKMRTPAPDHQ